MKVLVGIVKTALEPGPFPKPGKGIAIYRHGHTFVTSWEASSVISLKPFLITSGLQISIPNLNIVVEVWDLVSKCSTCDFSGEKSHISLLPFPTQLFYERG